MDNPKATIYSNLGYPSECIRFINFCDFSEIPIVRNHLVLLKLGNLDIRLLLLHLV